MLFVVFSQANPPPKLPGQTGPLALFRKLSSVCSSLVLSTAGLHSFQVFSPAFLSDGARRYSPQWVRLFLGPLAWVGVGGPLQATQFPKQFLQFRGARSYPQLWLQMNPPPMRTLKASTSSTAFPFRVISFVHSPLGLSAAGPHRFQELSPVLLVRWDWEALSRGDGIVTQHLGLVSKPGSGSDKTPCLRIQIR